MKNKTINNTKVGVFVIAGVLFLVFTLYMIGKNRNLLGATFTIKATVSNVNGLVPGNNVRFKGIDVGTVKSITVESDSAIIVTMVIDEKMKPFLRKNAIASIGTDGLMGNKLININSMPGHAELVEAGDVINSKKPVETDEMLQTLNRTNDNIGKISSNLYEITEKLNSSQSLWTLLSDTVITKDLKTAVRDFRAAGSNTADLTGNAKIILRRYESGEGLVNRLFTDTAFSDQLTIALHQVQDASTKASQMTGDLQKILEDIRGGDGAVGLILSDTIFRENLLKSASNIEQGTDKLSQNMDALRQNFLFRRYFRKLERERKNQEKAQKK